MNTSKTTLRERSIVIAEADARRLRGVLAARRESALHDQAHFHELESELERAVLVARDAMPLEVIVMDSTVRVLDCASGDRRDYILVYPAEANLAAGRISVLHRSERRCSATAKATNSNG